MKRESGDVADWLLTKLVKDQTQETLRKTTQSKMVFVVERESTLQSIARDERCDLGGFYDGFQFFLEVFLDWVTRGGTEN